MIKQKFRKKPVVIEAYQTDKELEIETLEGTMHASIGDWIITGVNGEPYPCKPDIFKKTYEPVVEVKDAEAKQIAIEALQQEPKRGKWIDDDYTWICSVCGTGNDYAFGEITYDKYCPNCGARMESEE